MISGDFGGPGAHFGSPGTHCEDFWDLSDFRDEKDRKIQSLFETFLMPLTHFFSVEFVCFFRRLVYLDFYDFGCPMAPFQLPF